jgi:hypothetical protein
VAEAFDAEAPLVLPAETPAQEALAQLVNSRSHCLIVADGPWATGLVTLTDLQRALAIDLSQNAQIPSKTPPDSSPTNQPFFNSLSNNTSSSPAFSSVALSDCRRADLVWLPLEAQLLQLEDQLTPNGLRQLPVFDVPGLQVGALPVGMPNSGLPIDKLRGLASRDGMALALARIQAQQLPKKAESADDQN